MCPLIFTAYIESLFKQRKINLAKAFCENEKGGGGGAEEEFCKNTF